MGSNVGLLQKKTRPSINPLAENFRDPSLATAADCCLFPGDVMLAGMGMVPAVAGRDRIATALSENSKGSNVNGGFPSFSLSMKGNERRHWKKTSRSREEGLLWREPTKKRTAVS